MVAPGAIDERGVGNPALDREALAAVERQRPRVRDVDAKLQAPRFPRAGPSLDPIEQAWSDASAAVSFPNPDMRDVDDAARAREAARERAEKSHDLLTLERDDI